MFIEALIIGLIAFVSGAVFCFLGYRLFRILIVILGFALGLVVGAQVLALLLKSDVFATPVTWLAGIVLGIMLAALAYVLYAAIVTFLGSSIGYLIGAALAMAFGYGSQEIVVMSAGFALALLFGILILVFDLVRLLIIATTALEGAGTLVAGPLLIFGVIRLDALSSGHAGTFIEQSPGWLFLWVALAVIGGTFQMLNTQRYRIEEKHEW